MKIWHSSLTDQAENDLRSIHEYITYTLLAPEAAKRTTTKLMASIEKIEQAPKSCSIMRNEPWHTRGLRRKNSGNFAIFYIAHEETKNVVIIRVIYGGRNIDSVLEGITK